MNRKVLQQLIDACYVALNDRMYKDWPAVADLLHEAIDAGEKELSRMSREDILILVAVVVAIIAIMLWAFG